MSGVVVWLTGLPASGKTTLANRVASSLAANDRPHCVLDGDAVRAAMVPSPGYDAPSRAAFYATLARLAALLAGQGLIVLVPATAHRRAFRDDARALAPRFVEVFLGADVDACRARDDKGLYRASHAALPGAGLDYEAPEAPDVTARGGDDVEAARRIVEIIDGARTAARGSRGHV